MSTFQRDLDTVEELVDRQGVKQVVEMLAEVCGFKAEHIESNWQDKNLAAAWANLSKRLEQMASKLNGVAVPE